MQGKAHPSDSSAQRDAEGAVLAGVAKQLGVELVQKVRLPVDGALVEVDGAAEDGSVLVEVFARVGRLRGGQLHKVSTDTLKLLALRDTRPKARLILGFADQGAADSIVGWRAAVLARHGIEKVVVDLGKAERQRLIETQERQRMVNPPTEAE